MTVKSEIKLKPVKAYMDFLVEFYEEAFSLKAQFANLGPVKGVYFRVALGYKITSEKTNRKVNQMMTE